MSITTTRSRPDADRRRLASPLGLILAFMVAEVVAGVLAGSLALLSDAAHMLTDAGSLALALVAARLAARPPSGRFTFGLGRAEILSAQVNGAALLVLAGVIAIEAVQRLLSAAGRRGRRSCSSSACWARSSTSRAAWQLARAERRSLNVEGARAHVLTDLYASLGAAVAGAVVAAHRLRAGGRLAALLVVALMLRSGWCAAARLLPRPARGLAAGVRTRGRRPRARRAPGIVEVHDLHVWEVTSGFPALAAHVLVAAGRRLPPPPPRARALLARALRDRAHDAAGRPRARGRAARHRGPPLAPHRLVLQPDHAVRVRRRAEEPQLPPLADPREPGGAPGVTIGWVTRWNRSTRPSRMIDCASRAPPARWMSPPGCALRSSTKATKVLVAADGHRPRRCSTRGRGRLPRW